MKKIALIAAVTLTLAGCVCRGHCEEGWNYEIPAEVTVGPQPTPSPEGQFKFRDEETRKYIQIEIPCYHNWQDSYWSLVDTSTKTIHMGTTTTISEPFHIGDKVIPGVIGNVQVCKTCNLIRVKQEK